MKNDKIKIYTLVDPVTKEVRYIGKTGGDPYDRLAEHIGEVSTRSTSGTQYTQNKTDWILSLLKNNLCPIINVIDEVEKHEANDAEMYHVLKHKLDGSPLTNISLTRVTQEVIDDLPTYTNHAISIRHKVNKKVIARLRMMMTGKRLGGKPIKQPGRGAKGSNIPVPAWRLGELTRYGTLLVKEDTSHKEINK